jgi:hypothetical protein
MAQICPKKQQLIEWLNPIVISALILNNLKFKIRFKDIDLNLSSYSVLVRLMVFAIIFYRPARYTSEYRKEKSRVKKKINLMII